MPKPLIFLASAMLFVALLPLPYGYYQFLRLVVFGVCAYSAYLLFKQDKKCMAGFLLALGLLFNPFISVHLNRQIWAVIDVATGLFLSS